MPTRVKTLDIQVPCPHCKVGRIPVQVIEKEGGSEIVGGIGDKTPRTCLACKKYSAVKIRMDLYAVPFEPGKDSRPVTQGDLLRNLIKSAEDN